MKAENLPEKPQENPPEKPTIRDIADIAGVSHSTVSRALNGSPLISSSTTGKIRLIAERLGFEFNESARRLKNRKTGIIGVIYYSALNDFRSSLYTNELFRDLRHNLERFGLDALLVEARAGARAGTGVRAGTEAGAVGTGGVRGETVSEDSPEDVAKPVPAGKPGQSNIIRLILQNKVDGFIIIHPEILPEEYSLIKTHNLPVVHVHTVPKLIPRDAFDCFFTDNFIGGRLAGEHLITSGCRKIQVVRIHEEDSEEFHLRSAGCLDALAKAGLSVDSEQSLSCSCSYEGGYEIAVKNIAYLKSLDGIFVPADITAFGFLNALREAGISVPGKLKVIGFDDSPVSRLTLPTLTTIHQPRELLTEMACRRMNTLLFEDAPRDPVVEYLSPSLVVRGSTLSSVFRRPSAVHAVDST